MECYHNFLSNLLRVILFISDPIFEKQIQLITFGPGIFIWMSLSSYSTNEVHVSQVNFQVIISIFVIAGWPGTRTTLKSCFVRFIITTRWWGWETFVWEEVRVGHLNCLCLTRFRNMNRKNKLKGTLQSQTSIKASSKKQTVFYNGHWTYLSKINFEERFYLVQGNDGRVT